MSDETSAISCFRSLLRGLAKLLLPMFWRRLPDTGRVVTAGSFCRPLHVHSGDAYTRFPLVQAGTSRQKAPAANPVGVFFFFVAHFAACSDVGHGARRQLPHRLDCILFARTMGSVCRDCQISENLLEQPSASGDAGCGFAGDDDDVRWVRVQEVRVLPENSPGRGIGPSQQMRGRHGLGPTLTIGLISGRTESSSITSTLAR